MKIFYYLIAIAIFPYFGFAQEKDSMFINNIELALKNPKRVKYLLLEKKYIDTLNFKDFVNLKSISLTNCNSQDFFKIVSHFKYLEVIQIDRNLDYIPPTLTSCKNLKILWIINCSVEQIPPFIGDFENLVELSFGLCSIKFIPISLFRLKKLKYFHMYLNSKEEQEIIRRNLPNCKCEFR